MQTSSFLCGGGQEAGRRAGTENVLLVAGLGAAAQLAHEEAEQTYRHMLVTRDRLQARLTQALPQVGVGPPRGGRCRSVRMCVCVWGGKGGGAGASV